MNAMQALATANDPKTKSVMEFAELQLCQALIRNEAARGQKSIQIRVDYVSYVMDSLFRDGFNVAIQGNMITVDWSEPNREQYRCHKVAELAYLYGSSRDDKQLEQMMIAKARVIRENSIAAEADAKTIREAAFTIKIDNEPVSVTTRKPQAFEAVKDVTGLEPTFKREYVRRSAVMRSPSEEEAYQAMVTHEGWVSPALYAQSLHKMLRENPTMTHSELAYKICKSYVWLMCFLKKHPDDYVPVTVSNESIVPKALVEKYKDALKSINPTTLTVEPAIREAGLPAPIVCVVEEDGTVKFDIENGRIQNPCGEIILNANAHFVQVSGDKNACPIFQAGKKPCSCDKRRVLDYGCDCGGY